MKILLTHGYFLQEDEKELKIMRPYPPLGLLYIAALLEQNHFPCDVFDTTFRSKTQLFDALRSAAPHVLGIYTNLMTKINVIKIVHFVKATLPGTTIIIGGPDVRYNSENYLSHGADVLVIGEGEQTMLQVVQRLEANASIDDVPGIAYLDGSRMIETAEREKLRDLTLLPFPARNKIDLSEYLETWRRHHGTNTISVSTMRGCPYTCKWCSRGVYGLSYRRRSAENVVKELIEIQQQYQPDSFWFVDDVFTISHKWLSEFSQALKQANLSIKYECITRADRMNESVVAALRETGCFRVWIGAESGSQRVIDLMDRRVDVQQVRDMIRLTRRNGIEAGTFIMLGYPGETDSDIYETVHHLKQSDPDHFTITIAYPIKGTDFYNEIEVTSDKEDWTLTTDRQIQFEKTYRDKYYHMRCGTWSTK